MQVLERLAAAGRAIEERIGWNRIGIAFSGALAAGSLYILYRMLRHIEVGKVVEAIQATPPQAVVSACLFVALGYITLTLYDYFALGTIGRGDVPYHTAALASFTSYTIGHNLGAAVFTGGAVRLRIYSAWGLGVIDVGKIAFITGLTFWLGNVFVLGCALAYAPEAGAAVTQLPDWAVRVLGLAGVLGVAGYVGWVRRRPRLIGRANWQIALPNARLTLAQIAIGVLDFAAGSLAFYMLVPAADVGFAVVAVAFVSATLLGFISHAPGSLGIFDATLLIALAQLEREALVASLLVFRLLYFVVPFALALVVLGVREVSLSRCARLPAK
jgi:hypothetical protein